MYEMWLDIRDRINNRLIRFLSQHCCYDASTLRLFVSKTSYKELEYYNKERVSNN